MHRKRLWRRMERELCVCTPSLGSGSNTTDKYREVRKQFSCLRVNTKTATGIRQDIDSNAEEWMEKTFRRQAFLIRYFTCDYREWDLATILSPFSSQTDVIHGTWSYFLSLTSRAYMYYIFSVSLCKQWVNGMGKIRKLFFSLTKKPTLASRDLNKRREKSSGSTS